MRRYSLILFIVILLSLLLFTSCHIQTYHGKETEFTPNFDEQSYAFSYMYLSEECDVVIPSEYNGFPVTKISSNIFWNQEYLRSLTIPATVTHINEYAFSNCVNLEKVIFEEGSQLDIISSGAFTNCSSLKEIELPESLEVIEGAAFSGCTSLESIRIPGNVREFNGSCFERCTSLKSVTLDEENQTYTKEDSFIYEINGGEKHIVLCLGGDSDGLLRIPDDVVGFDYWRAFVTCKNVDTVYMHAGLDDVPEVDTAKAYIVAEDNPYFCSIDGVVYSKDKTKLIYYPRLKADKNFTVLYFVDTIEDHAFYEVKHLEKVVISEGVKLIGNAAFRGCNIKSIELPDSLEIIDNRAFYNCDLLEEIKYAGTRSDFATVKCGDYWIYNTKQLIVKMTCSNGNRYLWRWL